MAKPGLLAERIPISPAYPPGSGHQSPLLLPVISLVFVFIEIRVLRCESPTTSKPQCPDCVGSEYLSALRVSACDYYARCARCVRACVYADGVNVFDKPANEVMIVAVRYVLLGASRGIARSAFL